MEKQENNVFKFYTKRQLVEATGLKAETLRELFTGIKKVDGSSIFYHTHTSYLEHHFVKLRSYNDFAMWISGALQEHTLSEKISGLDIMEFTSVKSLREAMIKIIGEYLQERKGERQRKAAKGDTFYFCKTKSFVFFTGIEARSVEEFFESMRHISPLSLYYHVFESRLRLQRTISDFSVWLKDMNAEDIAEKINKLDPYAYSLNEFREKIISLY